MRVDSRLGRELFYVGFRVEETDKVEKKVWLFSNWHGVVMIKAVVHQAQWGEDQFPAGPRPLLSWFQGARKKD